MLIERASEQSDVMLFDIDGRVMEGRLPNGTHAPIRLRSAACGGVRIHVMSTADRHSAKAPLN